MMLDPSDWVLQNGHKREQAHADERTPILAQRAQI